MWRLISWLVYMMTDQARRESTEYLWEIYEKVRSPKGLFEEKISGCILHRIFRENGCNIPVETYFDGYPELPHGSVGIFISQGARIGKRCIIFQQVTIGSNTFSESKGFGAPVIGDDVYIGAGARIIGNVRIGNRCRIGAGCVVTKDVPDDATVVAAPVRIILHEQKRDNTFQEFN